MLTLKRCASTDNFVFTLYYRWTVLMLLSLSFVITCRLLLGNSFTCFSTENTKLSPAFIEQHCYAQGTFIDLYNWNKSPGKGTTYRGISPAGEDRNRLYISYYSWINLVLVLHACYFYLPHLIWKYYENGLMVQLTGNMDLYMSEEEKALSLCVLAKYLVTMQGKQKLYAYVYIGCELLNHVIALAHITCIVCIFQITGTQAGIELETWRDFGAYYFPLISKCLLYNYDKSGIGGKIDALCSLPLNNLYMYTFLFLYAWYIFLAVVSGIVLVYRMALIIPQVRVRASKRGSPLADPEIIRSICNRSSYADWFVLSRVQKNLLPSHFADLMQKFRIVSQCCEELDTCDKLIANQMLTTSFSAENEK